MLTERTLKKWRKEALKARVHAGALLPGSSAGITVTFAERILRMTQELLDQHLLRKR